MNEMIERVAKAIYDADGEPMYRQQAIAAIKAMREPTKHMRQWGGAAGQWSGVFAGIPDDEADAALRVWETMIDIALGKELE